MTAVALRTDAVSGALVTFQTMTAQTPPGLTPSAPLQARTMYQRSSVDAEGQLWELYFGESDLRAVHVAANVPDAYGTTIGVLPVDVGDASGTLSVGQIDLIADYVGHPAGVFASTVTEVSVTGAGTAAYDSFVANRPAGHGIILWLPDFEGLFGYHVYMAYAPAGLIAAIYEKVGRHRPPAAAVVLRSAGPAIQVCLPCHWGETAWVSVTSKVYADCLFAPDDAGAFLGVTAPARSGQLGPAGFAFTGQHAVIHPWIWGVHIRLYERGYVATRVLLKFTSHELANSILQVVSPPSGDPLRSFALQLLSHPELVVDVTLLDEAVKPAAGVWPEATAAGFNLGEIATMVVTRVNGVDVTAGALDARVQAAKLKRLFVTLTSGAPVSGVWGVNIDNVTVTRVADGSVVTKGVLDAMSVRPTLEVHTIANTVPDRVLRIREAEAALGVSIHDGAKAGSFVDWFAHTGQTSLANVWMTDQLTPASARQLGMVGAFYAFGAKTINATTVAQQPPVATRIQDPVPDGGGGGG